MLISINGDKMSKITRMPHKEIFDKICEKLSNCEFEKIISEINNMIEGNEVNTSSWMPEKCSNKKVFAPILSISDNNKDLSSIYFGIIVFYVFMKRDDTWSFGRYKLNSIPIRGMTYFRVNI